MLRVEMPGQVDEVQRPPIVNSTTTAPAGTPGGTLGAPTEGDLKRDQRSISERTDTRTP